MSDAPFDPSAQVEKNPALAARHVFHFHPTEGRQVEHQGV